LKAISRRGGNRHKRPGRPAPRLTQDQTRSLARLHQLLASIHPGLERALDLTAKGALALLAIAAAGRARIVKHLKTTPALRAPGRDRARLRKIVV
jgi:hypothetical protein